MASLQINNVPDEVMAELRQRAQKSHRAIEDEAASILAQVIAPDPARFDVSAAELVERARGAREGHPSAWVTEEFLRAAKDDGRA